MNLQIDLTKSMSLAALRELDLDGADLRDLLPQPSRSTASPPRSTKNAESKINSQEDKSFLLFPLRRLAGLGRGSSSRVYKSVRLTDLCVYAEKVLVLSSIVKRQQIIREIESLKLLSLSKEKGAHHVVRLFDVLQNPQDGTLSLLLEFMDRATLQDVVAMGGCCNETTLSSIAYQMLEGLHFLHDARIVHRDIKPSNVLMNSAGQVKLSDLGLAKSMEIDQSLAESFVGTFEYMAPERLNGDVYSFASDIWSLGLTLHTVATGRFPYSEKSGFFELLQATQSPQLPLPTKEHFSSSFIAFIAACCVNQFRERPSAAILLHHAFVQSKIITINTDNIDAMLRGEYSLAYKLGKAALKPVKKFAAPLDSKSDDSPSAIADLLIGDWKRLMYLLYNQDADSFRKSMDGSRNALYVTRDVLTTLAADLDIDADLLIAGFRKALKQSRTVIGEMLRMMQADNKQEAKSQFPPQHYQQGSNPQLKKLESWQELHHEDDVSTHFSVNNNSFISAHSVEEIEDEHVNLVNSYEQDDLRRHAAQPKFQSFSAEKDEDYEDDFEN